VLRRVSLVVVMLVSLPALATAGVPLAPAATDAGTTPDSDAIVDRTGAAGVAQSTAGVEQSTTSNAARDPVGSDDATRVGSSASVAADASIVRSIELHLTPEEPGTYEAVVRYDVPEDVTQLEVTLGSEATVTSSTGFDQQSADTYAWTESTNQPTLQLRVDANQTADGRRAELEPGAASVQSGNSGVTSVVEGSVGATSVGTRGVASADEGLVFADAGPWALVRLPRVGTYWRWSGSGDVRLEKESTVDGPGATGGEMAYLGDVERYEAAGREESVTLVVPERAELNETPTAILDSVTDASERLRVGARSDEVFLIAAPETVEWGVAGLQYGTDDAWVRADAELSTPDNVWLHEYVHTRQTFETTDSARWTIEATAEYYAALLTFEQGHVTYDEFRENLARGQRDRYDDDVLAAPASWSGGTNYLKGALAAGAIDLRMREATDRRATLQNVFRDLNAHEDVVSNADVLAAVEDAAGTDARAYAADLTRTSSTADTWGEPTHGEYFGSLPAIFEYRLRDGAVTASGVLGDRTLDADSVTLVAGETLTVDVSVSNVGGEQGTYETELTVDDSVVSRRGGELSANASTTESFERTFDSTGTYTVSVADRTIELSVVEPAAPVVESVDAPSSAAVGENVTFTVTYRNEARVPGDLTVPFSLDGESVATRTVTVPAESSIERTYSVSFGSAGEHTIGVGETTRTITITGEETTAASASASEEEGVATPIPGFGVPAVVLALALVLVGTRTRHH
jgi:hypothetical protein